MCLFNIHLYFFQPTYSSSIQCDALPLRSISPDTSKFNSIPKCNILSSGEILLTLCKFKLPLELYIHTVALHLCRNAESLCQKKMYFINFVLWVKKQIWFSVLITREISAAHRFSFPIQNCECRANVFLSLHTLGSLVNRFFFLNLWTTSEYTKGYTF